MGSKRVEAQQFRETRNVLPEEHKTVIEEQIRIIESRRAKILAALRERGEIPDRVQRSLEHLGYEGHGLLADLIRILEEPDPSTGEIGPGRAAAIIDEKLRVLRSQLEALGGSTREQTLRVLERYELENSWFGGVFDEYEQDIFEEVLVTRSDTPPDQQTTLDIGIGAARASRLALKAVESSSGSGAREHFARNLYAFDIMERFVRMSRETLGPYGVPPGNIIQGDFLDFPPEFLEGQFDCAWAGMHTLWHCTTEAQLRQFLQNIERALKRPTRKKKGGRLFFDTVGLYHHQGIPNSRRVGNFHDLFNFYDVLIRRYREDHIDPLIRAKPPLLRRFPIHDDTTGAGFYNREVLTKEYIDYVLKKMRSRLCRVRGPIQLTNNAFPRDKAKALGFQWIKDNQLEDWLRREIAYRLDQIRRDPTGEKFFIKLMGTADDQSFSSRSTPFATTISPLYALPKAERDIPLETHTPEVQAALDKVALRMVHDYVQFYYVYEMT